VCYVQVRDAQRLEDTDDYSPLTVWW